MEAKSSPAGRRNTLQRTVSAAPRRFCERFWTHRAPKQHGHPERSEGPHNRSRRYSEETAWSITFGRSLTFVRDDARFRCESCGHHGQSAQCSHIICTISIRLSFAFTITLGRDGTVWPMCLHLRSEAKDHTIEAAVTQRRLRGRSPLGGPSHSFGMTRVFVASLADITDNRRNARILSAQSRSDYLSHLR